MVEKVSLKDIKKSNKYTPYISQFLFLACLFFAGYKMYLVKEIMNEDLENQIMEFKQSSILNPYEQVQLKPNEVYLALWHVIDMVVALFIGGLIYAKNCRIDETKSNNP